MDYLINIIQGNDKRVDFVDINIVIDVIRAFSTSFIAFKNGVKDIILVNEEEKALGLKSQNRELILVGEIGGFKIESFDFGNSPYELSSVNLNQKSIVFKTTNGVKATLNSLNANRVFVTGFSNAKTLAEYIKSLSSINSINIIASHPHSEDDLAVAEYIRDILLDKKVDIEAIKDKIKSSHSAKKFYDINQKEFNIIDMEEFCLKEESEKFIMEVKLNNYPMIYKISI